MLRPILTGEGSYTLNQHCDFETKSGDTLRLSYNDCAEILLTYLQAIGLEVDAIVGGKVKTLDFEDIYFMCKDKMVMNDQLQAEFAAWVNIQMGTVSDALALRTLREKVLEQVI